jgi:vesicular inhibitory amino acid transporter
MQPKYGYPRWLNLFALWMIVINPVTKFGLCSRPLNLTLETVLGITEGSIKISGSAITEEEGESPTESTGLLDPHTRRPSNTEYSKAVTEDTDDDSSLNSSERRKFVARVISRTIVTGLCTTAAIFLPGFGRVMAFVSLCASLQIRLADLQLGSFSAFLICIILPVSFCNLDYVE